jgi:hypothetical protein
MMPISSVNAGAARPLTAAEKVHGTPEAQRSREETQGRPLKPVMDEYVPEEKREPFGRYWLGRDGGGQPKIYLDDPERAPDSPERPEDPLDAKACGQDKDARGPEKKGEKEHVCIGSTDKVDREIERLRKKKEELEQRISTETDEARIQDLERQLAQVERELRKKDNDTYRRQHSTFTQL